MGNFLQPGRLAKTGIDAAAPILEQISELAGFPEVFVNIAPIVVLFLAWLVVIVSFFVLAVQLFVTLIEFKLTTLAGFVLVPFALWNKTAFLAEKVLGNVVSSGIKVLVLAVIVGIGSGLFAEFQVPAGPSRPSTRRWSSCWPRCRCWPWASSGRASRPGWYPVGRSSARARWPVLPWGRGAALCRRCRGYRRRQCRGRRGTHGPGAAKHGGQRCACCWLRPPAARPHTRRVPLRPAAASRALPLAWAMSPRPARRRLGRRWPMVRAR
jgi:hypothetical protein